MHHAHGRGIVHRDLKPANILLAEDGDAQDHRLRPGQARWRKRAARPQPRAPSWARPSYMAPEQASGNGRLGRPGRRRLRPGRHPVRVLTGRPPFRRATMLDTLEQVRSAGTGAAPPAAAQGAARPGDHLPQVPAEGTRQALRQRPRAGGGPGPLPRGQADRGPAHFPRGERAAKWARRRPALAALLAVLVVALATVAGLWIRFTADLQDEQAEVGQTMAQSRVCPGSGPKERPQGYHSKGASREECRQG